jgi:diguanylate cyclase (GGDEF)-like protein/PAS domain S-box-containing protein
LLDTLPSRGDADAGGEFLNVTEQMKRPPSRAWLGDSTAGLSGAAYGAFVVWWFATGRHAGDPASMVGLIHILFGAVVAFLTLRVAGHLNDTTQRLAWRLIAASAALSACIEAGMLAGYLTGRPVSPIHGAVALLLVYPIATLGLGLLPPAPRRVRDRWSFAIDTGVVAVGGAMALWSFLLRPALAASPEGARASLMQAAAAGDVLVLIGLSTLLLRCPRGGRRLPILLLAGSQAALLVADAARVAQGAAGDLYHPVRALQALLIGIAAVVEYRRLVVRKGDEEEESVRPMAWLPYAGAGIGCATLIAAVVREDMTDVRLLSIPAVAIMVLLLIRLSLAARDIVWLRRERATLVSEARFRSLVRHSADMIYVVDSTWSITFASPSVPEALGYRTSHLVGTSVLDLVHPEDVPDAANRLRECLSDPKRAMRAEWRVRRNDQTYFHTETVFTNLTNDDNIRGVVLTARDISERKSLENQLMHTAFHDPLTGLANRALFQDRLQHALARRREQGRLGVVFLDLDHFKAVNDNHGHAGGDALLRAAAQRLVSGLRAFDTAGRLGGDEFAIVIDDIPRDDEVIQVAERVARQFREPFLLDGREVMMSASVGVALAAPGQTAEDLLRNSDLAMYLAKTRGRGQAALFESGMHADATARRELQRDLRTALERGELSLVYQPIHVFETQAIIGAEALLRWVHPTHGPVPPSTFVPMAEETGLMVEIGAWVLKQACRDAQRWRTRGDRGLPVRVWINLSARQLPGDQLFRDVEGAIAESGIVAGAIVLELTERTLAQHEDQTLALMTRLKALGIRLAIDDFGTGYSSLSHLQRLPIDILKIDRVFVDAIASDEHASALARTVVSLGESMALQIVAEGIETAEQMERLQAIGCDGGQGFFFSMPMSAEDFGDHAERARTFSEV